MMRVFLLKVSKTANAHKLQLKKHDILADVVQTLGEIHQGKFPAKPNHFACSFCNFKRLCTDHTLGEISNSA